MHLFKEPLPLQKKKNTHTHAVPNGTWGSSLHRPARPCSALRAHPSALRRGPRGPRRPGPLRRPLPPDAAVASICRHKPRWNARPAPAATWVRLTCVSPGTGRAFKGTQRFLIVTSTPQRSPLPPSPSREVTDLFTVLPTLRTKGGFSFASLFAFISPRGTKLRFLSFQWPFVFLLA